LILSNADSDTAYDGTNADTRRRLHDSLGDAAIHDRLLRGNHIGHNKFVVYVDPGGTAKAVLTGSTNWTATGMCSQSNNVTLLEDEKIAARYLEYWKLLLADTAAGSTQEPELRTPDAVAPPDLALGDATEGVMRTWFSPNTVRKSKPPQNPPSPPDMAEVFDAIGNAKHGVLFLLFSAGAPSILQRVKEVETERRAADKEFFVRGAISDERTSREFATSVYNDSSLTQPNTLITGIGGIDDPFAYWEAELAKLGHAVIHDKVLVVDPFSDDCLVVNGSHNLGYKASYSNDENLCMIRGNRAMAETFTAHVLDIVNHYNWRFKRHPKHKTTGPTASQPFRGLDKTDGWQDKYFTGSFLASRDRFFFPEA
jgi:phosphatidylserine/phosphatidylglycerophosphate/cardiolipin synthase-like enzyme